VDNGSGMVLGRLRCNVGYELERTREMVDGVKEVDGGGGVWHLMAGRVTAVVGIRGYAVCTVNTELHLVLVAVGHVCMICILIKYNIQNVPIGQIFNGIRFPV